MGNSFFVSRKQLTKDRTYLFAGATMHYSVLGKGKPVVLLHGSMIADPWGGFEKTLARHYTVYLPHLPGFGASDAVPGRRHDTDLFARAFSAFLRQNKLEKVPVIGCSLGCVVAAKSATQGALCGPIIFVGAPIRVDSRLLSRVSILPVWFRRMFGSTSWGRKYLLIPALRDVIGGANAWSAKRLLLDLETTDTKALVDLDVHQEITLTMSHVISQLTNTIYALYGSNDPLGISGKNTFQHPIVIQNAGHNIFTDQPEETLRILRGILG